MIVFGIFAICNKNKPTFAEFKKKGWEVRTRSSFVAFRVNDSACGQTQVSQEHLEKHEQQKVSILP